MRICGPLLGTLFLVASCAGQPDSYPALAPAPPQNWASAEVSAEMPDNNWLDVFGDPTISDLVREALAANPSLRSQAFTVAATQAQARATYGRSLPNVSIGGSAGLTSTPVEIAGDINRLDSETFGLDASLSWEADLWGRVDAQIDAARADLVASQEDFRAARLSLAGQTVIAWFDLSDAIAQQRVAAETVTARERALELTERRFSRGLSTALDVRTARSSLASAEASVAAREQATGNAIRRLEILLGRYPSGLIEVETPLPLLPTIAPGGAPADVLVRRPDVAASEARLVAAGFRAEQARLSLFPSISITARASSSEDAIGDALDPARLAAQLISNLSAPVFTGGALRAEREAAQARAESAAENYVSTVLTAWNEVEDTLAADGFLAVQETAQTRALEEARLAEELGERQYANGLISIFNLIDLQTRRLTAESSVISARSARASNRVRYHLALGGGAPELATGLAPDLETDTDRINTQ